MQDLLHYDIIHIPTGSQNSRNGTPIIAIIAHCIQFEPDKVIDMMTSTAAGSRVSSHYYIPYKSGMELSKLYPQYFNNLKFPEKAPIIQFVEPEMAAWHAGISYFADWNKTKNADGTLACQYSLNACTLGIEFQIPEYAIDGDLYRFGKINEIQFEAGFDLIQWLKAKYQPLCDTVLAHSTISVVRAKETDIDFKLMPPKTDPGPMFPWHKLNNTSPITGLTGSTSDSTIDVANLQKKLYELGFVKCSQSGIIDDNTRYHVDAFMMQFGAESWELYSDRDINASIYGTIMSAEYDFNLYV